MGYDPPTLHFAIGDVMAMSSDVIVPKARRPLRNGALSARKSGERGSNVWYGVRGGPAIYGSKGPNMGKEAQRR